MWKIKIAWLTILLSVALLISLIPTAMSQQVRRVTPYVFVGAIPNPVHVGDDVLLHVGITLYTAWPQSGWKNLKVIIERPDGKVDTIYPVNTDTTGGTGVLYRPTIVGTYYVQVYFPEQKVEVAVLGIPAGSIMNEAWSEKLALIVREEPLEYWPGIPLPSEYWSRPVNSQFREWACITGNWLAPKGYYIDMDCPGNDDAPETPHILWAKPLVKGGMGALGGGLAGGDMPWDFEYGDAYEGLFGQPVVIGGVVYFNRYKADGATRVEQEVVAVDIRTGEELWIRSWNRTRLAFGQLFYWDSFNYHGVFAYLIATRTVAGVTYWDFYEASTGRWAFSYSNVPAGTNIYGPKGEILRYNVNVARGWLMKWNSTRVVYETKVRAYGPTNQALGSWVREYMGTTFDARLGIEWNVTIPRGLTEAVPPAAGPATVYLEDRVMGTNFSRAVLAPKTLHIWALSTAPGKEGKLLFNITWTNPRPDARWHLEAASVKDGVFVLVCLETTEKWGFDINTGKLLWGPTEKQDYKDAWSYSSGYFWDFIYNGKLYSGGCGGTVYVYDVKTGKRLWTYDLVDRYHEWTFGNNWFIYFAFVADGKLYLYNGEHSPNNPLARGSLMVCLDAETGGEIWKLNFYGTCWGGKPVIGDNIIIALNLYDMQLYAIGKGPTATTVQAPESAQPTGTPILIKGTVMDISPGTRETSISLRFPGGVPAVADEFMGDWMEYVYMQFPRPSNVKGVWVKIDAINVYTGEYLDLGGTHTDETGFYTVAWTPPKEGLYKILATFPGTKSYWPSHAETSILVSAPTPAPEIPTPASPEQVSTLRSTVETLMIALTALLVIVIIIGAYSIYSIRKLKKQS